MLTERLLIFVLLLFCSACGGSSGGLSGGGAMTSAPAPTPTELTFSGVGPRGIFDPSITLDPATGRIWMSYSEVADSAQFPSQNTAIETRLAFSDDSGANWTDAGLRLNQSTDINLPQPAPNNAGTITHEVSSLIFDPGAPASERWKIFWHRYLEINGSRNFQHGWIALKTAPAPTGPWSAERKLFVGSNYDTVNDSTIGPPEIQLHLLDPELNTSLVFSEPGTVATADALYLTMLAAEGTSQNGRIILLKLPHATNTWEYKGSFLVNAQDGPALNTDGYSAPDLYKKGSTFYLIATPQVNNFYGSTQIFEIDQLETATLRRTGGVPEIFFEKTGEAGSFNGAATYIPEASASGLIFSQTFAVPPPFFRIFRSLLNP